MYQDQRMVTIGDTIKVVVTTFYKETHVRDWLTMTYEVTGLSGMTWTISMERSEALALSEGLRLAAGVGLPEPKPLDIPQDDAAPCPPLLRTSPDSTDVPAEDGELATGIELGIETMSGMDRNYTFVVIRGSSGEVFVERDEIKDLVKRLSKMAEKCDREAP